MSVGSSSSVVVTAPDTDPLGPSVRVPLSVTAGVALAGVMLTVRVTSSVPPWPSSTVTVKVSVAGPAPAALWRAVAVGV